MRIIIALVVALTSSAAFAGTSEGYSMGGSIEKFQPEIDRANATGELFRIKGHCQSNCTLFLGLRNVCVERSATLLFHAGHDRGITSSRITSWICWNSTRSRVR
ncbi:hypothetical protein [Bradyrhizobium macuxiense]|uniref:hypothetical protein n=1 Tax=Bradyrhizobium macuxiense TaxID=1755647 RepID=UPI001FD8958D|nr:hypothetical protein [Bradyrhizobium macuxiense]